MEIKRSITITNEEETRAFGLELGKNAKAGQVIALIGDLGTGKTTLTKSIAEGLGVTETISSPTYTIVKEYYSGRLPLYHFDVYRISEPEEMYEIGFEEYLYAGGVCLIEWAELIKDILPKDITDITIEKSLDKGFEYRRITIGKVEE